MHYLSLAPYLKKCTYATITDVNRIIHGLIYKKQSNHIRSQSKISIPTYYIHLPFSSSLFFVFIPPHESDILCLLSLQVSITSSLPSASRNIQSFRDELCHVTDRYSALSFRHCCHSNIRLRHLYSSILFNGGQRFSPLYCPRFFHGEGCKSNFLRGS